VEDAVTRCAILCVLISGCSIVWAPDPTQIGGRDGGMEAGMGPDGGWDAGRDGGVDAGMDGGCARTQQIETTCDMGMDEDCDGKVDCFDYDCRGDEHCCRSSAVERQCPSASFFEVLPTGTTELMSTGCAVTDFGLSRRPRALISDECQPVTFGMRFDLSLDIVAPCDAVSGCDWAALTFTNVKVMADGSELDDQFRVVVSADGSARVERAGSIIPGATLPADTFSGDRIIDVRVELEPGPEDEDSNRDVLYATITAVERGGVTPDPLLRHVAIMPLADVHCLDMGRRVAGLYAAIEGRGEDILTADGLYIVERSCASPSQFREPEDYASVAPLGTCATGGVGAPALFSYCAGDCATPVDTAFQWEAWVDSSNEARDIDFFRRIDFGICSYAATRPEYPDSDAEWRRRENPVSGFDWAIPLSSREPTVLPIAEDGDNPRVSSLWYAYARRTMDGSDDHEIWGDQILPAVDRVPDEGVELLSSEDVAQCASLRDPLLLADWQENGSGGFAVGGAWLLFTCEPASGTRSIRAVHLNATTMMMDRPGEVHTLLEMTPGAASYAARGVSAPEGFSEPSGETNPEETWRIWYTARNSEGTLQLAFAQGRAPIDATDPPALEPYPANPILRGSSEILGGDCSMGCAFTGASVSTIANQLGGVQDYQFLIARSRNTVAGAVHELVPLLQPRPID
jgi:hypothetical protein